MKKRIFILFIVGLTTLLTACGGSKSDKTPIPELNEQSKLGTQHTLTPEYTFTSTLAGTIEYQGSCSSSTTQATAGENTIKLNPLEWWGEYDNCEITVISDKGKVSLSLKFSAFEIIPELAEVKAIGTSITLEPSYSFSIQARGTIETEGACTASAKQVTAGENTITLSGLKWFGEYENCKIIVQAANGKKTLPLNVSAFKVIPQPTEIESIGLSAGKTPSYSFYSDIAGTLLLQGSCSTNNKTVSIGENTITFNPINWWQEYKDCKIIVQADNNNESYALNVSPFVIYPRLKEEDAPLDFKTLETVSLKYIYTSTQNGKIVYSGDCKQAEQPLTEGENTLEFGGLKWWITYNDCKATLFDSNDKEIGRYELGYANTFRTVYPATHPLSDTGMTLCANFPRSAGGSFPASDHNGNFAELKVGLNCDDFGVTQTEDGWDGEFVIPAGQDATHGRDALAAQNELKKVGHGHGGYDFTKLDKDGNELDYSAEEYACIRDNHTGLTWEAKTEGHQRSDLHSGDARYLWYTPNGNNGGLPGLSDNDKNQQRCANMGRCDTDKFIKDVNLENYCGLKNWRLPTYNEIASIVNVQSADDQMDHYVENPILRYANSYNFTSDFIKKDSYRHIISSFNLTLYFPAFVLSEVWESPNAMLGVVLVSEPSDNQEPLNNDEKYEALTEATVLDKNTGLIWTRCPATMKGDNNICDTLYYWDEALAAVQTANSNDFLGYSDWRLPSIYELTSLQAFDRIPMINQDVFSIDDIENKSFWSSTPSIRNTPSSAGIKIIHFNFYTERMDPSKLDIKHHVLLVRGGK